MEKTAFKLISSKEIQEKEKKWATIIKSDESLHFYLSVLFNSYREIALSSLDDFDPADFIRTHEIRDQALIRIGIPLFDSTEDWNTFYSKNKVIQIDETVI